MSSIIARSKTSYKSVSGAEWVIVAPSERDVLTLTQKFNLPEILARIISSRNISVEQAEEFLSPTIRQSMPDPFHLLDMEKASERIASAVINQENIVIYGDYDVDGATSSALLKRYFRALGVDAKIYIPDRIKEGYGPNSKALLELKKQGADICITVDCGTMSFEPLADAAAVGLDMIVIDHHLGAEELPKAFAIVNPNRLDETSPLKHLAAVGMCFLLTVAVNAYLRKKSYFDKREQPDLLSLLDIVALGTVCDVVPLSGLNRAFVSQGLKIMRRRENIGLAALADIAGMDAVPAAYHLGFVLGPRINAGGRVGKSDLGARLLSTENPDEAYDISQQLDHFNAERKALEQIALESAMEQIEAKGSDAPVLFAKSEGWHPGVIGIVSSRITERYNKPSAVISINDGIGKASARSISGIDFGSAIVAANQSGLLLAGGGHAMAAGFTVEAGKIDVLHEFLCSRFAENIEEYSVKRLKLDGYINISAVTIELARLIERLSPFGISNPEPRFIFPDIRIIKADIVGSDHIRCIIGNSMAGGMGGSIRAMSFRSVGTELGDALLSSYSKNLNIAGKVKINSWQGVDSVQVIIDDVAFL